MMMPFERPSSKEEHLSRARLDCKQRLGGAQPEDMAAAVDQIWTLKAETEKAEGAEKEAKQKELQQAQETLLALAVQELVASDALELIDHSVRGIPEERHAQFYEQVPGDFLRVGLESGNLKEGAKALECVLPEIKHIPEFSKGTYKSLAEILLRKKLLLELSKYGLTSPLKAETGEPGQVRLLTEGLMILTEATSSLRDGNEDHNQVENKDGEVTVTPINYFGPRPDGTMSTHTYEKDSTERLLERAIDHDPRLFTDLSVITSLAQRLEGAGHGEIHEQRQTLRKLVEKAAGSVSSGDRLPYRDDAELEKIRAKLESIVGDLPY